MKSPEDTKGPHLPPTGGRRAGPQAGAQGRETPPEDRGLARRPGELVPPPVQRNKTRLEARWLGPGGSGHSSGGTALSRPVAEVVAGERTVPPAKEPPWRRRGRPCQPRDKHGWCPGDRRLQEAPAGHQRWDQHTRQVAPVKRPSRTWKRLDMARPPGPKPTLGFRPGFSPPRHVWGKSSDRVTKSVGFQELWVCVSCRPLPF